MSTEVPHSRPKLNVEPASNEELRAAFNVDADPTSDNDAYSKAYKAELEKQKENALDPEDTKNRTKSLAKLALIAVPAVGVGVIGSMVAGSIANNTTETSPTDNSTEQTTTGTDILPTQSASPNATQLPSVSPSPASTAVIETLPVTPPSKVETKPASEVIPAHLEKFAKMTPAEFAQQTKADQLAYWSWQSRNIDAFAAAFYDASKDPRDKPVAPSENNTAQEIDTIAGYNMKFIYTIESDAEREKALTAIFFDGQNSEAYDFWLNQYAKIPSEALNIKLFAKNVFKAEDSVANGPRHVQDSVIFQDIMNPETKHSIRTYFMQYTNAEGEATSTWIRE